MVAPVSCTLDCISRSRPVRYFRSFTRQNASNTNAKLSVGGIKVTCINVLEEKHWPQNRPQEPPNTANILIHAYSYAYYHIQ